MTFKCENCGEQLELEEIPDIGQHLQCPTCGHKTSFSKPSRIELPIQAINRRDAAKPKLGVHRQEATPPAQDLNAQAILRNIGIVDQENQQKQAREDALRKKAQRELAIRKLLILLVLAGLVAGGVFAWLKYRAANKQRQAEALAQYRAEQQVLEEKRAQAQKADQQIAEQRKREREVQQQQQREESERRRQEALKARQDREAKIESERLAQAQLYKSRDERQQVLQGFRKAVLCLSNARPADLVKGAVKESVYCAVPTGNGCELLVVDAQPEKSARISCWTDTGEKMPLTSAEFMERLTAGAVFRSGKKTYLLPPQNDGQTWNVNAYDANPTLAKLGEPLHKLIRSFKLDTEKLQVKLQIVDAKSKKLASLTTLNYNQTLSEEVLVRHFQSAVEKSVQRRPVTFKPTVILYDGGMVKKMMGGITMVPRHAAGRGNKNYQLLYDEACRQEDERVKAEKQAEAQYREDVNNQLQEIIKSTKIAIKFQ